MKKVKYMELTPPLGLTPETNWREGRKGCQKTRKQKSKGIKISRNVQMYMN